MSGTLFEILDVEDRAEEDRLAGTRATIAARQRTASRFQGFVDRAVAEGERQSRIDLVDDEIRAIVAAVCEEYDCPNPQPVYLAARETLSGGHKDGCECGFCKNKGKLPGSGGDEKDSDEDEKDESEDEKEFEKESKAPRGASLFEVIAAGPEDGDSYEQERVKLPAAEQSGLGGPNPKTDKSSVPAEGLKDIEVPSKRNPSEMQAMDETTGREPIPYGTGDPNPASSLRDRIDADVALQPEKNTAPNTDTWTGTEGLADPVTSAASADWDVV